MLRYGGNTSHTDYREFFHPGKKKILKIKVPGGKGAMVKYPRRLQEANTTQLLSSSSAGKKLIFPLCRSRDLSWFGQDNVYPVKKKNNNATAPVPDGSTVKVGDYRYQGLE